ncbi:MAG: hypothetical protein RL161_839 [Bacteroidota bacterium]|jgi:pyruvate dehydrogenase E1 component alpha subunit
MTLANSRLIPDQLNYLNQMLLIRRFEERSIELYGQEKIRGFLHLYNGEEAVAVGVIGGLTKEDRIISSYREHGHALAAGVEPNKVMAELFGKKTGCSRGRGGSMHLFDLSQNFFGGLAIVGGHLPLAVGMARADRYLKRDQITCCFLGEGAVAEGIFHESMNLAGLWKAPVLFVVENNLYAMGTPLTTTLADGDFSIKAKSYGIDFQQADGMDLNQVLESSRKAIQSVRNFSRPFILVLNTYRFRAHSMFDAELYREKSEVEKWKLRDPILLYTQYLKEQGVLTDGSLTNMTSEIDLKIEQAVQFAEQSAEESLDEITTYLTYTNA